jgi:L-threonylcarbamoyladenylate synthase
MQKNITLQTFLENMDFFIAEAKAGKIFVYPTDTIYGIGCIYTLENVEKIYAIKKRDQRKMFSVIAPSFDWIEKVHASFLAEKNIHIDQLKKYLDTYHGVTYIFDYNRPGVRIIKHPFQSFVEKLGEPFITTSCNVAGEAVVDDIKKLPTDIAEGVDYIIDAGLG